MSTLVGFYFASSPPGRYQGDFIKTPQAKDWAGSATSKRALAVLFLALFPGMWLHNFISGIPYLS